MVHNVRAPNEDEELHPFLWRFWNRLPERGGMALFDHSWYRRVLVDRVEKRVGKRAWESAYDEIGQFERTLVDDGTLVLKFFLHISREEQKRRFKKLEKSRYESWRVTRGEWAAHRKYDQYLAATEEALERTSTAWAPWTVVPAHDKHLRRMRVLETLAAAMERALDERHARAAAPPAPKRAPKKLPRTILDSVDLSARLTPARYEKEVQRWQERLRELEFACYAARLPVIAAFEGWDAAGKGGAIRRLVGALDPRGYTVFPIAAPKGDDATHHYLWRFWRRLPKAGHLAVFDRTWYGRVLVERVEGLAPKEAWRRAYREINEFERLLADDGVDVVKIFLAVSKDEQRRRFEERLKDPYKQWKISEADLRARRRWGAYVEAVDDAFSRTDSARSRWHLVAADRKWHARTEVLRIVTSRLARHAEWMEARARARTSTPSSRPAWSTRSTRRSARTSASTSAIAESWTRCRTTSSASA